MDVGNIGFAKVADDYFKPKELPPTFDFADLENFRNQLQSLLERSSRKVINQIADAALTIRNNKTSGTRGYGWRTAMKTSHEE